MTTKVLGKYEIIPTTEQLMAVVEYFEKQADEAGNITFTQREMFEDPIVSAHYKSPSFLNGVNTYLTNEGYMDKIEVGTGRLKSHWNVAKLLKEWDKVKTREVLGVARPARSKKKTVAPKDVAIEVAITEPAPAPAADNPNTEVLAELRSTMEEMAGFLQKLPSEMGGHLSTISSKLDLVDSEALSKLQAENESLRAELAQKKEDFESEVQGLKTELEVVSSKSNYSIHSIYRQCNSVLDDVNKMIEGPAWAVKTNGPQIRKEIKDKLFAMMKELGVDTDTSQGEQHND